MTPRRRIIPVFVPHLGCPNTCVFCNQRRISGQLTPMTGEQTGEQVLRDIEKLNGETACVAFYGGSFTAIPAEEQEELLNAVQPFLHSGQVESIRLSTRPDAIDAHTVERLKKYGVKTVELGVQSMDEEVLTVSKRGHTAEDARRSAKMLLDAGFEVILQMMTGLPGDTREKSLYTASEFIKLKPHGVRIYPTVIIEDTELFDMWREGSYGEHTVSAAAELCAELADMFDDAGIPVIRMGLNPTDDLSGGAAAGGAYHPAFGEIVASRRYLSRMEKLITERDKGQNVVFGVGAGCISAATGQKRANSVCLSEKYALKSVKFRECPELGKMEIIRLDG